MTNLEALRFAMRDALLEAGAMYGVSFAGELDNVAEECVDVAIGWGEDKCWICDGEGISGLYRDGNPKICKRCQGSGKFNVPDEPTEDQIMDLMNAPSAAERRAEAITIQERLK